MRPLWRALCAMVSALGVSGCATPVQSDYTSKWTTSKAELVALPSGAAVRTVRTGIGPPLVLLHTIRTQLDYFERLVPLLSQDFEVYAIDLPGHGQSSQQAVEYTEAYLRKAVGEFIVQQNLTGVTLMGESIGGVLALTVAAEHPERIRRVISLNPYDYGEQFGGGIRRSQSGWMVGLFSWFGKHTPEPRFVTAAVLRGGFHDPEALPANLLDELSRAGFRDGYREIEYSVFKNWQTWIDARQLYARVSAPVTLIYGRDDWSAPEDRKRTQAATRPAETITLDNAGHFTALEQPEAVAHAVLKAAGMR